MPFVARRAASLCVLLLACAPAARGQVSVTTQRYDGARTGQNLAETTLTTSNVSQATFGKLFTRAVDDEVYAQPLYVPNVSVSGVGVRNVLYVATVNNSVYAFDADDPTAVAPLWRVNLTGSVAGARPVNNRDVGQNCGNYKDFSGQIGIVGTPVIDAAAGTLFVVARTKETGQFVQRLHALNIASGAERAGSPVAISASAPGTGDGASGGLVPFNPQTENQRGSLLLAGGTLYITWASHCDTGPYHGWLIGYNPATLSQVFARCVTPNGGDGGVWQSGTGPSVDASGNLFLTVGNGTVTAPANGQDYGNAFLKLSAMGQVVDWFIPYNWSALNANDVDLGSAGVLIVPSTNLLASGGKEGKLYLLDRSNLGHFHSGSDSQIVQSFQVAPTGRHFHGTPTYWNGPGGPYVYTWCEADRGKAVRLSGTLLTTAPVSQTTMTANDGMPGGMLAVSANGATAGTGILWAALALNGDANQDVRPGILRAFDAADLSRELWNSRLDTARDDFGNFAKFNTPVVANGKVYLATFSHQVAVYGLLPAGDARPTVSAGPDQTIALPSGVTLAGAASDDGIPGPLATQWIQVSGPAAATIASPSSLTTSVSFSTPGTYVQRLTASDGALAADSDVTVSVLAQGAVIGAGAGVQATYYDTVDLTGPTVTRVDPTIDFDWADGSPAPSIAANTFSARWTGQVQAQFTEAYTFTTLSDDGVRLWINNQLVVDNWTDHGAVENAAAPIALVKGQRYDVRMEYYERTGSAVAALSWSSASTPKTVVPQLQLYAQPAATNGGDTVGAFVPSTSAWFLRNAINQGPAALTFAYGPAGSGWVPLAGDWDGDGDDTPGLYEPATGTFFLRNSNAPGAADLVFAFGAGAAGYVPVAGDWDGDGTDTIGVYNPATGAFFLRNSNSAGAADVVFTFGAAGAGLVPLAGNWDGNGGDTVGLYDPARGTFFLRNANAPGAAEWVFNFGPAGATPLGGDWNADGIDTVGVYVPSTGAWFLRDLNTFGPASAAFAYGPAGARPVTGNWDGQ
jgi:hypothetical protein